MRRKHESTPKKKKVYAAPKSKTVKLFVSLSCTTTGCPGTMVCDSSSGLCIDDV